jgi:hypothetical protein
VILLSNPALQYPGSNTQLGVINMDDNADGGSGQGSPPILYSGVLYQVLQFVSNSTPPPGQVSVNVFQSTNGGTTWTILNQDAGPTKGGGHTFGEIPQGGVWFDGNHTITVAVTTGDPLVSFSGTITFQDFNLNTGLWGPTYGNAGSPSVYGVNQIIKRLDGTWLVIVWGNHTGTGLEFYIYNPNTTAWTGPTSLTGNLTAGWSSNGSSSPVLDPNTGIVHMFGDAIDGSFNNHTYYQQIQTNNTVNEFQDTTALFYPVLGGMANPILVNGNILWGVTDATQSFATLLVGTPLSAPVFSVLPSPGLNPSQAIPPPIGTTTLNAALATDGTNIYACFPTLAPGSTGPGTVWVSYTSNLAHPSLGWTGNEVYNGLTGPTPLYDPEFPRIAAYNGTLYIAIEGATVSGISQPTNFFMAAGLTVSLKITLRGVKRRQKPAEEAFCAAPQDTHVERTR